MGKYRAVLFARVSTKRQSFNRQRLDLLPLIESDGYSDDEIKIIEYKESAIKNDIQSRKSISELTDTISQNDIENVYVTEISRLARRDDVLYKVLAVLEERHISLVIQSPQLIRTYEKDANGVMVKNPIAAVLIAFMQHLAITEMEIKKDRAKSGREAKIKEGCITSPQTKFGYDRVAKKPQINVEQSSLVIRIYNEYLKGNSVGIIWDNIKHFGLIQTSSDKYAGQRRVYNILTDKTYIGENGHFNYPPILDKELFYNVQKRLKDRAEKIKACKTNNVYYCKGLIHYRGKTLTPSVGDALYTCKYGDGDFISININVIDWLASTLSSKVMTLVNVSERDKRTAEYVERRLELSKIIDTIDGKIKDMEEEIEKNNYMFQKGKRSVEVYEYEDKVIRENIDQLNKEKEEATKGGADIDEILKSQDKTPTLLEEYSKLSAMTSDNEIYDNVHKCIENIELEKVDKKTLNIRFSYNFNVRMEMFYYQYVRCGSHIKLYKMSTKTNKRGLDLSDKWEKRIIRHSDNRHKK